jgi:predicted metal-binding protein
MTVLICRTCPRYDPRTSGEFGRAMAAAIAAHTASVAVRGVQCLGGCPEDGVVAVDGPGKARVRFNGLNPGHAEAVIKAAAAHDACLTGAPEDWEIPAELAGRISAVTRKRPLP